MTFVVESVDDFDDSEGFDLILVIGVLEYATNHTDGSSGGIP
ncbi:MAG: hypothetical protein ACJZ17_04340 [Acidimicrobiales bacterium]